MLVSKIKLSGDEAKIIVEKVSNDFPVISIEKKLVSKAIDIHLNYKYRYWDSLVIATALMNDCDILYSEDLHDGQVIEHKLTIVNPF